MIERITPKTLASDRGGSFMDLLLDKLNEVIDAVNELSFRSKLDFTNAVMNIKPGLEPIELTFPIKHTKEERLQQLEKVLEAYSKHLCNTSDMGTWDKYWTNLERLKEMM